MQKVILVDEADQEIGICEKIAAHQRGYLHRAVSVWGVRQDGAVLIQKRSAAKYHSPGVWSVTACTHPQPGETVLDAARRALSHELGLDLGTESPLHPCGVTEYRVAVPPNSIEAELTHVIYATLHDGVIVRPNPDEVSDVCWIDAQELEATWRQNPEAFSSWFQAIWHVVSSMKPRPDEG